MKQPVPAVEHDPPYSSALVGQELGEPLEEWTHRTLEQHHAAAKQQFDKGAGSKTHRGGRINEWRCDSRALRASLGAAALLGRLTERGAAGFLSVWVTGAAIRFLGRCVDGPARQHGWLLGWQVRGGDYTRLLQQIAAIPLYWCRDAVSAIETAAPNNTFCLCLRTGAGEGVDRRGR